MPLTAEERKHARALHEAGYSASMIAAKIRNGATRNVIIGISDREGWPKRGRSTICDPNRGRRKLGSKNPDARAEAPKPVAAPTPEWPRPIGAHKRPPRPGASPKPPPTAPKTTPKPAPARMREPMPAAAPVPEPEPVFGSSPVTLADLRDCHCRYPIGDPVLDFEAFRYCGADKPLESSWCALHASLVFNPLAKSKRKAYACV